KRRRTPHSKELFRLDYRLPRRLQEYDLFLIVQVRAGQLGRERPGYAQAHMVLLNIQDLDGQLLFRQGNDLTHSKREGAHDEYFLKRDSRRIVNLPAQAKVARNGLVPGRAR